MKQRVCKVCGSVMKKQSTDEGFKFFCKKCDAYTEYDEADMEAYCPDCGNKISHVYACCGMSCRMVWHIRSGYIGRCALLKQMSGNSRWHKMPLSARCISCAYGENPHHWF